MLLRFSRQITTRVRGLLARFKDAKEADDTDAMIALGAEGFTDLTIHTTIEEELFYPWASGLSTEIKENTDEGIQEHHVREGPDGGDRRPLLDPTSPAGHSHPRIRQKSPFSSIRSATSAEEREAMGAPLDEGKRMQGAPVVADMLDPATAELKELASAQEIPGRSSMDHDELAATVAPPR